MKASDLKGIAVVSLEGAVKMGHVDDVLFDTSSMRIIGFDLKEESGQHSYIPFPEVHRIGRDAVTVNGPNSRQIGGSGSPMNDQPRIHDLEKLKVVDDAGTFLGTVSEIEVAPETGEITSLQAQRGGVFGIGATKTEVSRPDVRSVGPEVLVVSTLAEAARTEPPGAERVEPKPEE